MDRKRREPLDGLILQVGRRSTSLADSRSTSPSGELPACSRFKTPGGSGHNLNLWQDRLKSGEQLRMRDHWDDRLVGLESVLLGERNLAQQTLEIVIFGYAT